MYRYTSGFVADVIFSHIINCGASRVFSSGGRIWKRPSETDYVSGEANERAHLTGAQGKVAIPNCLVSSIRVIPNLITDVICFKESVFDGSNYFLLAECSWQSLACSPPSKAVSPPSE